MVAVLALLLTGCLKLDMDLAIGSDDTVSGSIVFGVSKDVLELTGGSAEDLLGGETPFPSDQPGVTAQPYDDGDFAGQEFTFDGVPIAEFSDQEDPDALTIVREGDTFEVSGVLDLSSGATGATGPDAEQFFSSAEIRVAITFPGEVIEANGDVDGNTVAWEPNFGERLELQAVGSAIDSGGDSNTTMLLVIGGAVIVVIIVVVAIVMSRRKKGPEPATVEVGPEAGMAAPASAAAPAAVPPAAPAAVPPAAPTAPPAAPTAPPAAPPASPDSEREVPTAGTPGPEQASPADSETPTSEPSESSGRAEEEGKDEGGALPPPPRS